MNHICNSCKYFDWVFKECKNPYSTNEGEHTGWMHDACDDWTEDEGMADDE